MSVYNYPLHDRLDSKITEIAEALVLKMTEGVKFPDDKNYKLIDFLAEEWLEDMSVRDLRRLAMTLNKSVMRNYRSRGFVDRDDFLDFREDTLSGSVETECDYCGEPGARPCVKEKYIVRGITGHDVPVRVGDLCDECREEEDAVWEEDF